MLFVPVYAPVIKLPITGGFRTSAVSTTPGTAQTFTTKDIGTAAANRLVVVTTSGFSAALGPTVSSATIGGNAATIILQQGDGTGADVTAMIALAVAAGTTATIVINFSAVVVAAGIGIYAIYAANATPSATAHDNGNGFVASTSINCPANGAIISGVGFSGDAYSAAWAGVTERFDTDLNGSDNCNGGFDLFAAAQTGLTVSSTATGSSSPRKSMVTAAFTPA